jgi:hypothetical protein
MKALSLRQPWASLILAGVKVVENRSWSTDHRGLLAIHASAAAADANVFDDMPAFRELYGIPRLDAATLPRGAILGTVELVDCRRYAALPRRLKAHPFAQPGCWCWLLANPKAFPRPIPATGKLRLWDWTPT